MRRLTFLLLVFAALAGCRSGGRTQTDEASQTLDPGSGGTIPQVEVSSGWTPRYPYWSAYRAAFLQVACDSSGTVLDADTMFSYATPAETDSIRDQVRKVRFDIQRSEGKVWWLARKSPTDPRIHFIVPVATHGGGEQAPPLPVSRRELEAAGLGPWLAIWDDLIPGWRFETWRYQRTNELPESPDSTVIDDKDLVARGMVSVSPDSAWKVHPFVYTDIDSYDGSLLREPDGGFIVYRNVKGRQRYRKQVTGTPILYLSADWIDSKRFVVTGVQEVDIALGGKGISYSAPMLIVGDVNSTMLTTILGPPVPPWEPPTTWPLDQFIKTRYRAAWKAWADPPGTQSKKLQQPAGIQVTRAELEAAGLGPWLVIWDDLVPDRPIETWTYHPGGRLRESRRYPPVEDGPFLERGMVSTSPDGAWRVHPFLDIEFHEDGTYSKGVDAGYLLYRVGPPARAWPEVIGSSTNLYSADWLDSKRFVITALSPYDRVVEGNLIQSWAPTLILGRVDSLVTSILSGPVIPPELHAKMWGRVGAYCKARYPKFLGNER